ncbi:penicillin-binding protein [Microbacterium azadirachtae]|uniref:penicillin-binding protein n=1 Tax=Microbacterium azadirachtae TaxID=582680 RepID=UPI000888C370|nr:penicillin-binding protein [Microbacterium azadirachtae]UXW85114.1 penicillin-binding protein [Microbacterium azadirachtae]SDM07667.1 Membrane carboxypeptidase (penicillin-binding protein) [Microbacterium azadirachtae]SEG32723.1 Membrane carboxypeptidase (penicillin-binding protein) [Microbacterium azadirachtae]SEG35880.1 Membrane carboxypeptidase (penicillin-binding protein) [Microbacterium azadirachtae]
MPQTKRTLTGVLGGLAGLVGLSVVAGVLVTAAVTPVFAVTGATAAQSIDLFEGLPSNLKVDRPMQPTTIYAKDANGNDQVMARFYDQNRVPVKYDQVAPVLYDALLASEDKNFYSHGGIDITGTLKAIVGNVTGSATNGGSSISQQYVKNVLLQECEKGVPLSDKKRDDKLNQCWVDAASAVGSKGIARKLQEIRYATAIEKQYSKNDILIGYLNLVNFGGTTYGIEAAAQRYFSVSASQLNAVQAATLVGMVQNPNAFRIDLPGGTYDCDKDGKNCKNGQADGYHDTMVRRNYVLSRMEVLGKITKAEFEADKAQPITPVIKTPTSGCADAGDNAYFCKYVQATLEGDPSLDSALGPQKDRADKLLRGGLNVYTTLSPAMQGAAVQAMHDYTTPTIDGMDFGAAAVNLDPKTGRILALAQNTVFNEAQDAPPGQTGIVYAADQAHGGGIGFSVGSTYKVFTLLDWLEKGHSLRESVDGNLKKMTFKCGTSTMTADTGEIGNFQNQRGFTGTPMEFTRLSLNSGFLGMASKLDLCDINDLAARMGVHLGTEYKGKMVPVNNRENVTDDEGNILASAPAPFDVLGSKNIAPLDMAAVYAAIANNGTRCDPHAIDKITGPDGADIPLAPTTCTEVIKPEIAAGAAYALQGVMNSGGTGSQANPFDGTPLIGKTGSHNNAQTMLMSSSTTSTTGVWVGQASGDVNINDFSTQDIGVPNIRYPLSRAILSAADSLFPGGSFPDPVQSQLKQSYTNLPSVVGMTVDQATQTLEGAGFSVSVGAPVQSNLPTDQVAQQDPGPGQVVTGSTITISPSNGQGATVPNVVGKTMGDAATALQQAGFQAVKGACTPGNGDDSGTVSATSPAAGTAAPKGSSVTLNYVKKNCQG